MVATCRIDASVGDASEQCASQDVCVVVDEHHVVAGVVTPSDLQGARSAPVETVMRRAPATVRPSEDVEALERRMRRARTTHVLVTRPDGCLLGIYRTKARPPRQQSAPHR